MLKRSKHSTCACLFWFFFSPSVFAWVSSTEQVKCARKGNSMTHYSSSKFSLQLFWHTECCRWDDVTSLRLFVSARQMRLNVRVWAVIQQQLLFCLWILSIFCIQKTVVFRETLWRGECVWLVLLDHSKKVVGLNVLANLFFFGCGVCMFSSITLRG